MPAPIPQIAIRATSRDMTAIVSLLMERNRRRAALHLFRMAEVVSIPSRQLVSYLPEPVLQGVLRNCPDFEAKGAQKDAHRASLVRILSRALLEAKICPAENVRFR